MLNHHIKSVHEPFVCYLCFQASGACVRFASKNTFDQHILLNHSSATVDKISEDTESFDESICSPKALLPLFDEDISSEDISNEIQNFSKTISNSLEDRNIAELNIAAKKKGHPGLANLAISQKNKIKHLTKSKPRIKIIRDKIFKSFETKQSDTFFCPVCHKLADFDPPTIECQNCLKWFHWPCVQIKRNISGEWFCKSCKN
ncbi:hypothetical protein SNE40_008592 [Patella caerulea]|uniref:PHD-type domain-containing protein n=1 Tax=Patella caerulea TaxID=87958 RepID=A0AAN8K6W8_PATCE